MELFATIVRILDQLLQVLHRLPILVPGPQGMRSPEQCLQIAFVELIKHVGAARLAPVLLIHHMKASRSICVNLRDLGLDALVAHGTVRVPEQLYRLAKDLDRVHVRLPIELHVSPFFHLLELLFKLFMVDFHDNRDIIFTLILLPIFILLTLVIFPLFAFL